MADEPDRPDEPALPERDTADSDCARWVSEFTADLRRMHEEAGKPSSRQMSRKAGYSHTTLLGALTGTGRRLPSLELTLGLVQACRGDEQAWRARWHMEHARIAAHALSRDRGPSAGQAMLDGPGTPPRSGHRLRWILLPALGVVVALAIGGVAFIFTTHDDSGAPPTYGLGGALPTCEQSGADIYQLADQVPRSLTSQQMKECIASFSKGPPRQPGPWPFFIYDTIITKDDVGVIPNVTPAQIGTEGGLWVWTTPGAPGNKPTQRVGALHLGSVVWADCYVKGYHPTDVIKNDDVGNKWLRIQWSTNPPNTALAPAPHHPQADPSVNVGYVYAGYTLPFTHNGKIPTCT